MNMSEKWEYRTQFLGADGEAVKDFLFKSFPGQRHFKYTPLALIPELNRLGAEGWELVSLEPVMVGDKGDVLIWIDSARSYWTATYLAAFKRRISD